MPQPNLTPSPNTWTKAAVLALAAMTIMANATIASSLPGLKRHFADVAGIDTLAGLTVTLPSLSIVLVAGLVGWLIDRVDRQKVLIGAALCYVLGGTAGLWADDLPTILAGRLVLGLGVAGTMTLAMTWATDLYSGPARARLLGQQGAAISGAGIVFMLAGGTLAGLNWRGAFAVYALILPVAALAFWALGPHAKAHRAAVAARRAAPVPAGALGGGFPWAAYAFIAPLAFVFQAAFYMTPTRIPFLLEGLGVTLPLAVAALMASLVAVSFLVSLNYGRLSRVVPTMAIFALSFVLIGTGFVIHAQAQSWAGVLAGSMVAGLGIGMSMPNYTTWFMAKVPDQMRGRASGLLTTAFFLGQFASPLVSTPLVARFGLAGGFGAVGAGLIGLGSVIGIGIAISHLRKAAARRSAVMRG